MNLRSRSVKTPTRVLAAVLIWLGHGSAEAQQPEAQQSEGLGARMYERYAVATDSAQASEAAREVLSAGGSAADGAAAAMLALGVTSPGSSGLGGGGFLLYWDAEAKKATFLDFRERAPGAASPSMFVEAPDHVAEGPLARPSQIGGLASGVPGEPAGIDEMLRRFGRIDRNLVVAPALRLAAEGMEVTPYVARMSQHFADQMRQDPVMARWFEADSGGLRAGQTLRQPELARTLQAFADGGAAAVYTGAIAEAIAASNRRAGGLFTLEDLASYRTAEREPLTGDYLGFRFVTAPPPSAGGFTMLQSLALLELWVPVAARRAGPRFLHALAESWKGPYLDRARYFGDPDHVRVPLAAMGASDRLDQRAQAYHPSLSMPASRFDVPLHPEDPSVAVPDGGGTSHLCVVDADGNVASVTTTINLPFGARYTAAGMVMNDEMDDFARAVGAANAFGLRGGAPNLPAPGKRPVSSMSPTIVFDARGPVLCVGAAGGSRIITATEQVALNLLVLGMEPGEAIAAGRVHHQGDPNRLRVEEFAPLSDAWSADLEARGHALQEVHHNAVVQLIYIDRERGRLIAASDPRKGGAPAGD
ncbi:MAG: gamma-glutamyltransferase [Myxococcota bacterium]